MVVLSSGSRSLCRDARSPAAAVVSIFSSSWVVAADAISIGDEIELVRGIVCKIYQWGMR